MGVSLSPYMEMKISLSPYMGMRVSYDVNIWKCCTIESIYGNEHRTESVYGNVTFTETIYGNIGIFQHEGIIKFINRKPHVS